MAAALRNGAPGNRWGATGLLLVLGLAGFALPAQGQSADVAVGLHVSKTAGLQFGDELLVSITVRNDGPGPAASVHVAAGQASLETFLYDLIGSESPECGPIEQIEVDPPAYSFSWNIPSIPVGTTVTCIARLRVIRVPTNYTSTLYAGAQPAPSTPDPDGSDNLSQVSLGFALPRAPHAIPADSWWAFVAAVGGVLLGGLALRRR
jgi:hypothetical protein